MDKRMDGQNEDRIPSVANSWQRPKMTLTGLLTSQQRIGSDVTLIKFPQ